MSRKEADEFKGMHVLNTKLSPKRLEEEFENYKFILGEIAAKRMTTATGREFTKFLTEHHFVPTLMEPIHTGHAWLKAKFECWEQE